MPKGPQGQKPPADAIDNTAHIAGITTGVIEKTSLHQRAERNSRRLDAKAPVQNTTSEDRKTIARHADAARWG